MTPFEHKAAYYQALGWPVFPIAGKRPLIKGGCHAASTDPAQIARWGREFPDANIAVATGERSGVFVIDIDGPQGEASWAAISKRIRYQPDCPAVITGKGRHLYFRSVGKVGNRASSVLGPGIDVRGDGGSAVLPPSIHADGKVYEWVDRPDALKPPLPIPALLRMIAGHDPFETRRRQPTRRTTLPPPELAWLADMVKGAAPGARNHTLNTAAFLAAKTVKAGEATRDQVAQVLTDAALAIGLERPEIVSTVRSGFSAGMKQ